MSQSINVTLINNKKHRFTIMALSDCKKYGDSQIGQIHFRDHAKIVTDGEDYSNKGSAIFKYVIRS